MADKPLLGLATTEELLREVIVRFTIIYRNDPINHERNVERALVLAEMVGGLSAFDREYRTADSDA
jgi:hypothetical protein